MPDTTAAPAQAAPAAPPEPAERFRIPKVRHAMILFVPKGSKEDAKVTVLEQRDSVKLSLRDHAGLEREVDLQLTEARALADHLNRICRHVANRPDYRP
jgi:hypothetical protein